jgi:hypothetical protein
MLAPLVLDEHVLQRLVGRPCASEHRERFDRSFLPVAEVRVPP